MNEAPPHPRDVFDLIGQEVAEAAFAVLVDCEFRIKSAVAA